MFNEEMAIATADAYAGSNNQDKCQFSGYFEGMWDSNLTLSDIKIKESIAGFQKLLALLKEQKICLENNNKAFAVKHTEVFIQIVIELLKKLRAAIKCGFGFFLDYSNISSTLIIHKLYYWYNDKFGNWCYSGYS